jgi:hypothetical protein
MVPDMDISPVVAVVCDRCHRPGWQLEAGPFSGKVVVSGNRVGEDMTPLAAQVGPRPHSYRLRDPEGARAGAFILAAPGPGAPYREKLVCVGRKHPRYERVITRERAARAYHAAVAAGRVSIGLADLSRA